MEKLEDIRHNFEYKEFYKKRSETIERVFADAKELHNFRYARFKGKLLTRAVKTKFLRPEVLKETKISYVSYFRAWI